MPTKWVLNETKCKGKRVEARESRIQTKWISKCSSPLAVQLKCFQHYGGTICICSAQEKKNSYTRSLAHRTCVFYIIHISISIGLIGIYNKEELIVLFAPVCTHNGWERDNANDCEERQRARGRELRADDILWVLRALQAFLWNTSSRKKMMQKKLRKVCTPKKVTTKANRTHTHTHTKRPNQPARNAITKSRPNRLTRHKELLNHKNKWINGVWCPSRYRFQAWCDLWFFFRDRLSEWERERETTEDNNQATHHWTTTQAKHSTMHYRFITNLWLGSKTTCLPNDTA